MIKQCTCGKLTSNVTVRCPICNTLTVKPYKR